MKKKFNEYKIKKISFMLIFGNTMLSLLTPIVHAEEDPLAVINNLSNFIFQIVQSVGVIMVLFGIVQFGLSLKSHDPAQRANSLFTILGGLVIAFAKYILDKIM